MRERSRAVTPSLPVVAVDGRGLIPNLNMFDQYWIEQFLNLLNTGVSKRRKGTPSAEKIIEAVQGYCQDGNEAKITSRACDGRKAMVVRAPAGRTCL